MIAKLVSFFGDPQYRARRRQLFIIVLVMTLAADFLVPRDHVEGFWQAIPGWGALYGFVACFLIVFVSKFLGHRGKLMRREDYYD
ncbi:hypothetical protein AZOA_03150 [Azoarcus sp. Aa7]|nr:hypothetical protein [Azoarcus sp. Aa7]